jgi:hypothetical protein
MWGGAIRNTGAVWAAINRGHEQRAFQLPAHVSIRIRWCDIEQAWDVLAEHASAYAWDKIRAQTPNLNAGIGAVLDRIDAADWVNPEKPKQGDHREAISTALAKAAPMPDPPERFIYGRGREGRRYLIHTHSPRFVGEVLPSAAPRPSGDRIVLELRSSPRAVVVLQWFEPSLCNYHELTTAADAFVAALIRAQLPS